MDDKVALLPCPFCGKADALRVEADEAEDAPGETYAYHVFCGHCHSHGRNNYPIGWCETEEEAREAWNHRGSIRPIIDSRQAQEAPKAASQSAEVFAYKLQEFAKGLEVPTIGSITEAVRFYESATKAERDAWIPLIEADRAAQRQAGREEVGDGSIIADKTSK